MKMKKKAEDREEWKLWLQTNLIDGLTAIIYKERERER